MRRNESRLDGLLMNSWFNYSYEYFFPWRYHWWCHNASVGRHKQKAGIFAAVALGGGWRGGDDQMFGRWKEQKLVRKRVLSSHFLGAIIYTMEPFSQLERRLDENRFKNMILLNLPAGMSWMSCFCRETIAAGSLHATQKAASVIQLFKVGKKCFSPPRWNTEFSNSNDIFRKLTICYIFHIYSILYSYRCTQ